VPKVNIIDTFPVLAELIRTSSHPFNPNIIQGVSTDAGTSLPVVQLPDSSCILSRLLSFIITVSPYLPSMEVEALKLEGLKINGTFIDCSKLRNGLRPNVHQRSSRPTKSTTHSRRERDPLLW